MGWIEPKSDWKSEDSYNAEDLNRVEINTLEVASLIEQVVDINVNLEETTTTRNYSSIEFADSLNRVERNLQKLSVINLNGLKDLKTTWKVGDSFSYVDAIRLENNLVILHKVLEENLININYCGTFNCGEGVI
ncbi:hypothetical protein [Clostridium gasigenes]|uniref:Uncharacterized protein n=1 Tax=Clostridium gasigenes TaxID=94869 RepID=A0A7X0SEY6_9CLOT|nr:hypothetical protein [Clostridium gasigenes]MBB6716375.1 hypothetical protein [Clostridium gasigenes]